MKSLDDYLTSVVGPSNAPDLSALTDELARLQKCIAPYLTATPAAQETTTASSNATGSSISAEAVTSPSAGFNVTGELRSRDDVLRLLDKICQYYARYEPSSPVPLILKRAARLAAMDFMQIIADLTPDSVTQIRTITGEPEPTAE